MSKMIAKVIEENNQIVGSLVELSNGEVSVSGRVAADSGDQFAVEWEDGKLSIEDKADYELVVASKTAAGQCEMPGCTNSAEKMNRCFEHGGVDLAVMRSKPVDTSKEVAAAAAAEAISENPAQPAGFAVPMMDANAYPDGELQAIEMEKRQETAEWEDAQNRAPIDGENPAQPAGYAVPEASGEPIPGQGADGLLMAANVYADDVSGENGVVELRNGDLKITGKVIASNDSEFVVKWEDDTNTVEDKSDYNLILNDVMAE